MPARPLVLDEIEEHLRGAVAADIVIPECCVPTCGKLAAAMISLRYKDGRTNVYGTCRNHLRDMKQKHPSKLEVESRQGAFFYAGS